MFKITCLQSIPELDAIRKQWDQLAGSNVMRSFNWMRSWWDAFDYGMQLQVVVVSDDDQAIIAILPMVIESTAIRGKRLLLMGSGKACGDDLGVLIGDKVTRDEQIEIASLLADWIATTEATGQWDRIDWDGVQANNEFLKLVTQKLEQNHNIIFSFTAGPSCWATSIEGGWEGYLKKLSKRARKMLREQEREYISTGRAQFEVVSEKKELHSTINEIARLHQARWDSRQIIGCFGTKGFTEFVYLLVDRLYEDGNAFLAKLHLDKELVAGAIGFWKEDELAMYLVGMDERFSEHRPGWMLNQFCLRLANEKNKKRVNFLRGDEPYKQRLGAEPTIQQRWVATSTRLLPQLRYAAINRGVQVRDWFRKKPLVLVDE